MSEKRINTDYQSKVTCPHCGDVNEDTWDLDLDEDIIDELECGVCEKKFSVQTDVTVEYSTAKIDPDS